MTNQRFWAPWKLYAVVVAIGVIVTGVVGYSLHSVSQMVRQFSYQISTSHHVRISILQARLAIVEYADHGHEADLNRFDEMMQEAALFTQVLLGGDSTRPSTDDTAAVQSAHIHFIASELQRELERLRRETFESISGSRQPVNGQFHDRDFEARMGHVTTLARDVEDYLERDLSDRLSHFQMVQGGLALCCLVLSVLVLLAFRHYEQVRSRALAHLQTLTERLDAELKGREALERRLEMTQFAVDHATDGIAWTNPDGQFVYVNETMCRMTEYSADELLSMNAWQIDQTLAQEGWSKAWQHLLDVKSLSHFGTQETKSGRTYPAEISVSLLEIDGLQYSVTTQRDITKREQARHRLEASQKQYQEIVDRVDVGVSLVDADERFVFANAVAEDICGVPRGTLVGRSLSEFVDPEQFAKFRRETQRRIQGESENYEADIIRSDGKRRTIRVAASPRFSEEGVFKGTFGLFRDVTDERRLAEERNAMEDRLRRAERMESLGLLAGGVAHDLNNMFSPIIGYPELILGVLPPDSKAIKWVKQMASAAESAADVIADLLTLARRGRYQMKPTGINDVLKEYVESPAYARVLERNPGIAFTLNLDPSVGQITGSATHLTKTFMNIITNAFEACSAGGSVSVTSHQQYLNRLPGGHDDIIAGEYVVVRVIDTGAGIPQEDIAKVFEPYFSRKKMGASGSGLGLSVVYGVVKDHHGYYDIRSEVGKGTEFALYFPVIFETADDITFTATSESRTISAPNA